MKKFKAIMLGVLSAFTLGLFVVTGSKVEAATDSYVADDETITTEIAYNAMIYGNSSTLFTIKNAGGSSQRTVTKTRAGGSNGFTVTSEDEGKYTYEYGLFANGNNNGFTITANKDITFDFYYTVSGSSTFTSSEGSTQNDALKANSETVRTLGFKNNVAYHYTKDMAKDEVLVLTSNSKKIVLLGAYAETSGFRVTYELNGGTLETGYSTSTSYTTSTTISMPDCTKAGYTFTGWSNDLDSTIYFVDDSYTATADITFTANFTKNDSAWGTVTFTTGCEETIDPQEILVGNSITLPDAPIYSGHRFLGWKLGNTTYAAGDSYELVNSGSIEFVAQWEEVTEFTVKFVSDAITTSIVVVEGETIGSNWPSNPTSPEYNTFDGWYTANKVKYTSSTTITSDVTLYSKFSGIKSTMSYMADDLSSRNWSNTNANGMNYGNLTVNAGGFSKYTSSSASYSDGTTSSNALQAALFTIRIVKNGTLKIYATQTSSQSRTFSVKNSNGTEVYSYQPSTKGTSNAIVGEIELTPGVYTVVGNPQSGETGNKPMNVAGFKFVANADSANLTVTAAQQETEVIDGYRYVRFVYIIDGANVPASALNNKLTLVLDEGTAIQQAIDVTPNCVKKITNGSNTYEAEIPGLGNYEFSEKTNVTYVVYVVKFTNSKYINHTISSTLDYNGSTYSTSSYTFTA